MPDLTGSVGVQSSEQTATSTPTILSPQQLSVEAADVLLSNLSANSTSNSSNSLSSLLDPSASAGATASTGDPLLDDLNAMDSGVQNSSNTNVGSALSQQTLNSFLLQQATASFQASQAMDQQTPSTGSSGSILGNTSA
jgi:hypothetical protein